MEMATFTRTKDTIMLHPLFILFGLFFGHKELECSTFTMVLAIRIQFVFNNIKIAGPLISNMPEAYALADKTSSAWVAFARTGNPNTSKLPTWPVYFAASRDTMLFNDTSRVEPDPDRGPRLAMERLLKL